MDMDAPFGPPQRYVGLDVHKHFVVVAAVDGRQQIVLRPCRLSFND